MKKLFFIVLIIDDESFMKPSASTAKGLKIVEDENENDFS